MARRKMLGNVELLGLGAFPRMSPTVGTIVGGATAGITDVIATRAGAKRPSIVGLGAGLALAGLFYAMRSTRHVAKSAALGAGLATLFTMIKSYMVTGSFAGFGIPQLRQLGIPQLRQLGYPAVSNVPTPHGTIPGVAGSQLGGAGMSGPPVSLLGQPSPAAMHLLGVGGPPVHGLATSYGATLLGGGR